MKMKFLSLLAAAAFVLSGCDNDKRTQSIAAQSAPAPVAQAPAPDVPSTVWPFTSSNAKIELSPNLLAKNYLVVFDGSGSMSEAACKSTSQSKAVVAKNALVEFAKVVPADANLGLVIFNGNGIRLRVPLAVGNANRSQFVSEVQQMDPGSGTPLRSAMEMGYQELVKTAQAQLGYGEYHLVVVTDGEANIGEDPSPVVAKTKVTPVLIHTIGFCIGERHSLNQKGVTYYQEAGDLDSMRQGLKGVLAEAPAFDASWK